MARGIDLSRLHGRTPAQNQTGVITSWKGILVYKKKAGSITSMSAAQIAIRNQVKQLSKDWFNVLTDAQRQAWNIYAKSKENLKHWDWIMSSTAGVIPKKKNIMSGFNAYISSNIMADSVNFNPDRENPPDTEKVSPPTITLLTYPDPPDTAHVEWTDPIFITTPTQTRVRLWAEVKGKAHKQLVTFKNFGVGFANFTTLKGIGGTNHPLSFYEPGTLIVQMDTIVANTGTGAEHSYFSNLKEITI